MKVVIKTSKVVIKLLSKLLSASYHVNTNKKQSCYQSKKSCYQNKPSCYQSYPVVIMGWFEIFLAGIHIYEFKMQVC